MMGWQWHQLNHMQAICTYLQKITTPAPHQSDFYGPDALPDTQPKALKAKLAKRNMYSSKKQDRTFWKIYRSGKLSNTTNEDFGDFRTVVLSFPFTPRVCSVDTHILDQ